MADGEASVFSTTKQEILEDLREKLVKDLQPEKLFAFLRSKRVLDEDDCEDINAERTRRKKVETFLDILAKKGQTGFDYFCEAFVVSGKTQLHLLNQILDAFETKIYGNEVEPLPLVGVEHEFINTELLNHSLPRPGEPGAPCLPSAIGFVNDPSTLLEITGNLPPQPQVVDDFPATYGFTSPPPPYSE